MVNRTLRQRLDYFCETWAELTADQKLDIMEAAPEFYHAASWLHALYTTELMKGEADE